MVVYVVMDQGFLLREEIYKFKGMKSEKKKISEAYINKIIS
jgi:hypothetical protein